MSQSTGRAKRNEKQFLTRDRRGHGRSSHPWDGNAMNTHADDLAALIQSLNLKDAILVGFSTGGGEVARYIGRHGTKRVAKAALVSSVSPLMLKTASNPVGLPLEVFDGIRAASIANRPQFYKDLASGPLFGFNRPGSKASQGMVDWFRMPGILAGHKNAYDCIKAFSETDFTEDLKNFDIPTLVVHGDDDVGRAGQELRPEGLCRRSSRLDRYAQRPTECRTAGLPPRGSDADAGLIAQSNSRKIVN